MFLLLLLRAWVKPFFWSCCVVVAFFLTLVLFVFFLLFFCAAAAASADASAADASAAAADAAGAGAGATSVFVSGVCEESHAAAAGVLQPRRHGVPGIANVRHPQRLGTVAAV